MYIIFLDVDGVLNTDKDRRKWGKDALNGACLEQYKRVVNSLQAVTVLSSTWRKKFEDQQILKYWFGVYSIPVWIDITPIGIRSDQSTRHLETASWLDSKDKDFSIIRSAILDDFVVSLPDYPDVKHFLTDDDEGGLTPDIADKVIDYLLNG